MLLLGSIMATYSWTDFKPIIYDPEKLAAWILGNLKSDPDTELMLHPDDPKAAELSEMAMDSEDSALEFWAELSTAEQGMMQEAFKALWGPKGAGPLPL